MMVVLKTILLTLLEEMPQTLHFQHLYGQQVLRQMLSEHPVVLVDEVAQDMLHWVPQTELQKISILPKSLGHLHQVQLIRYNFGIKQLQLLR